MLLVDATSIFISISSTYLGLLCLRVKADFTDVAVMSSTVAAPYQIPRMFFSLGSNDFFLKYLKSQDAPRVPDVAFLNPAGDTTRAYYAWLIKYFSGSFNLGTYASLFIDVAQE